MRGVRRKLKASEERTLRIDAANCRALAATISDAQARRKLEAIAADYESQASALEALEVPRLAVDEGSTVQCREGQ